ncbi:MAG: alkaline phosphatase D family protein [Actinomycetota bacterium]|nr:alkaline phosphatase D family protein [Actinomycetota bacterium]
MIWTRISGADTHDGSVPVHWRLGTGAAVTDIVAEGDTETGPERDFTVQVEVGGLRPATTYWYGFGVGEAVSPVGRTRTAPVGPVDHLRVGVVCCSHYETGYFNAYGRLADRDLDVVLHLGDSIYEDRARRSRGVRMHEAPARVITLADYRRRYAQYRTDPDFRSLLARHPVVAVWDDHELVGGAWRDGAARHVPDTDGDWCSRLEAATRAYREWTPLRLPDPADPMRLWRQVRLGNLGQLLILDTRLAGRERPAAGRRAVVRVWDRRRQLLGKAQWRWLERELSRPAAGWRLVASQVMVAPVAVAPGRLGINPGMWDGYPAERDRLLKLLAAHRGEAVVVSGDLHSSWASELGPAVEVSAPAVSAPTFARALAPRAAGAHLLFDWILRRANRHVRYVDTAGHGYVVLDLTPDRLEAQWWHVATVLHPDPAEHCAARFRVTRGEPQLLPS